MSLPGPLLTTILGCLLHDIGKPVQRAGTYDAEFDRTDARTDSPKRDDHSYIGQQFIHDVMTEANRPTEDSLEDVLDCIRFHHYRALRSANLRPDSPAYIAYIADNISAGADRRDKYDESNWPGFDKKTALASVFNVFKSDSERYWYRPEMLNDQDPVVFPTSNEPQFSAGVYSAIERKLHESLLGLDFSEVYLTSLLTVLEATLSYVPSSTSRQEVADISLFDHLKLTAAIGACLWHWAKSEELSNYQPLFFADTAKLYSTDCLRLVSCDFSGIQPFIYTIHSKGAAKQLRARSFYLDTLMENAVDNLLAGLQLSRANLLYSGAGHAYLLAPNTDDAVAAISSFRAGMNSWLVDTFGTALFVGVGSAPFSPSVIMDSHGQDDEESTTRPYSDLYREVSRQISESKLRRYDASTIRTLNNSASPGGQECEVCHMVDKKLIQRRCPICAGLADASKSIREDDFCYVDAEAEGGLPVAEGQWLHFAHGDSTMREVLKETDSPLLRVYGKNALMSGQDQSTHLWVGDYSEPHTHGAPPEFGDYVKRPHNDSGQAIGIKRLGVLRLDVDNLGQAFINGFTHQANGRYNTLSRSATFSRSMALFFKHFINEALQQPTYRVLTRGQDGGRRATIIYSGGDDVFVVGAWDDVLEFGIDFRDKLQQFSQGKLALSGGIGLYEDKYPISVMASEVGFLEAAAKQHAGKDALAVFSPNNVIQWDELRDDVLGAKYSTLKKFLASTEDKGHSFAYRLLGLLREKGAEHESFRGKPHGKTMSFARWVYLLSRIEPKDIDQKAKFREIAEQLHTWFADDKDSQQLELALWLYAYATRKGD